MSLSQCLLPASLATSVADVPPLYMFFRVWCHLLSLFHRRADSPLLSSYPLPIFLTTLCRHGDFILHIHPTETAVRSQCYYVEMPNVNLRGRFLTPRNVHVDEFNEEMLQHLPGNAR